MFEDLSPFGWIVISTEIGFEFSREDFESCGFTDTICTD
jgi:hypothetical protein